MENIYEDICLASCLLGLLQCMEHFVALDFSLEGVLGVLRDSLE